MARWPPRSYIGHRPLPPVLSSSPADTIPLPPPRPLPATGPGNPPQRRIAQSRRQATPALHRCGKRSAAFPASAGNPGPARGRAGTKQPAGLRCRKTSSAFGARCLVAKSLAPGLAIPRLAKQVKLPAAGLSLLLTNARGRGSAQATGSEC